MSKAQALDKILTMVNSLDNSSHVGMIVNYCVLFYKNFKDYESLESILPYSLYLQVCCGILRSGR